MSLRRVVVLLVLTAIAVAVPSAQVAAVNEVVTNCSNDTELRNDLTVMQGFSGGTLSFSCATATIPVTSTLPAITTNTTIVSADTITLDASSSVRLFVVDSGGTLSLGHIVLENGYFNGDGGSISNAGSLTLEHVTIKSSDVPGNGGAIYTTGPVGIRDSTFSTDKANFGGVIFARGAAASMTIQDSSFQNNSVVGVRSDATDGLGGAIYLTNAAAAMIRNTVFSSNKAFNGGAIALAGASTSLTLTDSTVQDNTTSQEWGGGIFANAGATTTIRNSTFSGNSSRIGGGVMSESSTLVVTDSTFTGNTQTLYSNGGGGLANYYGTATLMGVTFSQNTGKGGGAGIDNAFPGAVLNLTNVTFSGNVAGSTGGTGGGLDNYAATANLTNVTFAGNSAPSGPGGGISNRSSLTDLAHLHLLNVLVAGSPAGGNCGFDTAPDSSVTNMSSDGTCSFGAGRDSQKVKLGALADNGGTTQTVLPSPTSPVVDAGTNVGAPAYDQRGMIRPQGGTVDVGAVEVAPTKVESSDLYVQYDGWHGVLYSHASGGSYHSSNTKGETVRFTFSGKTLTWVTRKAPNAGKARVSIDGSTKCTCDLYASSTRWQQKFTFSHLGSGTHTVTITVTGTKNSHSAGKSVAVDGFITAASPSVVEETSSGVRFDDWLGNAATGASGGEYRLNGTAGAKAVLRFDGKAITLVTAKGPSYGKMDVLIDGVVKSHNLDLYAATQQWQVPLSYSGLTAGTHRVEIRPTHTKNASSTGFGVVVDAFSGFIDALP